MGSLPVFGADSRTRTDDLLITNELLYQLSHISVFSFVKFVFCCAMGFGKSILNYIQRPAHYE